MVRCKEESAAEVECTKEADSANEVVGDELTGTAGEVDSGFLYWSLLLTNFCSFVSSVRAALSFDESILLIWTMCSSW